MPRQDARSGRKREESAFGAGWRAAVASFARRAQAAVKMRGPPAGPGPPVVRHAGRFVHGLADAVSHEVANDRVTERLGVPLDGGAEVTQTRPGNAGLDRPLEALLRRRDETAGGRADDSDRHRARRVGAVAVLRAGEVDPHDVAFTQDLPPVRDPVDDDRVDRRAENGGVGRRPAGGVAAERRGRPGAPQLAMPIAAVYPPAAGLAGRLRQHLDCRR